MSESFYVPGEQRAAKVRELFDRIAPRYDLVNDLQSFGLHRHWKRRVLALASPEPGQAALDVCSGTGDLALGLARHGLAVAGVDFSREMLEVARARAASGKGQTSRHPEGTAPVFIRADAEHLPFKDNSFDLVTIGYGLRNLASWESGLLEMRRVARPGGRLLVLEFGKPDHPLWRGVYFGYLRLFVPCLGWVVCGNSSAYSYILESLKHYPAQRRVAEKMKEMGLANVRIVNFLGGVMSINYGEKAS